MNYNMDEVLFHIKLFTCDASEGSDRLLFKFVTMCKCVSVLHEKYENWSQNMAS